MPLITAAYLALAAGLLLGFGGEMFLGLATAATALVVALVTRRAVPFSLALIGGAGVLLASSMSRRDAECREDLLRSGRARVTLLGPIAPGERSAAVLSEAGCKFRVYVRGDSGSAPAGARVEIAGLARRQGEVVVIERATVAQVQGAPWLVRLRTRAAAAIDTLYESDAPLARALLVADASSIDPAVRDRFADAGIIHMVSVSGLHVAIIAEAVALFLLVLRSPRRIAEGGALAVTAAFVLFIGAPAPAVRAALMLGVTTGARLLQRPTSPWAAFALGGLVPLGDPRTVVDLGYQLSMAGMAGLLASGAVSRRLIAGRLEGWRARVSRELLATVVASIATGPIVAWSFGRLSLVAPLTNLAAGPLFGLAQPTLFLSLALVSIGPVAALVADASRPLLALIDRVAAVGAAVPFAAVSVAPNRATALLAVVAATCFVIGCTVRAPRLWFFGALAATASSIWLPVLPGVPRDVELHMIDVGQGDALALRTPRGRWVVFDAGDRWTRGDAGERTVAPYIRRRGGEVSAFVLSHPHDDHVGGAASVLRLLRPVEFWDAAFVAATPSYRDALAAATELGTRWRRVHPADSFVVDGVVVRFLGPDSIWTASLRDPNEASTIALVRYGDVRMLLTGDAESLEEAWLLERWGDELRADVLKVAHHGSRTSSGDAFLDAVRPRFALVSVGRGNRYGHPSDEVLQRLDARGVEVSRTDDEGTVILRTDGTRLSIESGVRRADGGRR